MPAKKAPAKKPAAKKTTRKPNAAFMKPMQPSAALAKVVGESSAPAGPLVFARELREARDLCAPGGEAVISITEKQAREWLPEAAERSFATILARRERACLLRISRPRGGRPGSAP